METVGPAHDPRQPATPVYCHWREAMADAVTDPAELCGLLDLPQSLAEGGQASGGFRLLVPKPFLARICPGDPRDPLLLQVLPRKEELSSPSHFSTDPLGELASLEGPGILWKYQSRLLIVTTGECAVHCRFCFRRHFPYQTAGAAVRQWKNSVCRVAKEPSIHEVILSGGDPLTLDDSLLADLAARISQIPHVTRLRLHTRLPIVIPQRVTEGLIGWLRGTRLTPIVVVHVNHPAEIDEPVASALGRLVDAGIPVLSQSVLLREVNDRTDVLAELFERLVNLRVLPYYLHQLDRVSGASHFEVPETEGVELIRELRRRLPGYAIPRYVRETPEGQSKEVLGL